MKNLQQLRPEIDRVDEQLVTLLAERFELVQQVGEYKKAHDIPPLAPERWQQVLDARKAQGAELGLPEEVIVTIYEAIHEAALKLEDEV